MDVFSHFSACSFLMSRTHPGAKGGKQYTLSSQISDLLFSSVPSGFLGARQKVGLTAFLLYEVLTILA